MKGDISSVKTDNEKVELSYGWAIYIVFGNIKYWKCQSANFCIKLIF